MSTKDPSYSKKQDPLTINVSNDNTVSRIDETKDHQNDQDDTNKKKKIMYSVIGGGILVAIVLIITLSVVLTRDNNGVSIQIPDPPAPAPVPVLNDPWKAQEVNPYTGSVVSDSANDWLMGTILTQVVPSKQLGSEHLGDAQDGKTYKPVNPKDIANGVNNKWASKVRLDFALIDNYQVQLNVSNLDLQSEYHVPDTAFSRPVQSFEARFSQVGFRQALSPNPYSFNLSNIYNGETLISTFNRKLLVTEKFSEIGFILPNERIFGLGQHNSQFQLSNGTYTLWAHGQPTGLPDDNAEGGLNGPHIHPFVLCQTDNKDFFGIFFAGSSAQSFEIIHYTGYQFSVLNYIQLGGQMEIYFIMRGTAQEILARYHALIGYSYVPPYYALGFFTGTNSFQGLDQVKSTMASYASSNMALEGVVIDNYNLGPNEVFTVSPNFQDDGTFASNLASHNQYALLGVKSGMFYPGDAAYSHGDDLVKAKLAVMSTLNPNQPLFGYQDTTCVYPDFQNYDQLIAFLQGKLEILDQSFHIQGLWLQHNQYNSLVNGEVLPQKEQNIHKETPKTVLFAAMMESDTGNWDGSYLINKDQSQKSTYNLPFLPGYFWSGNLDSQTISLNATHNVKGKETWEEMYVHNINGHLNLKEAFFALNTSTKWSSKGVRPFIVSDSTWAGSGKYGAVALSNMERKWSNLRTSISQAMSFSMYGVSNVISDVCGGLGRLDEELCGRWAQLSAFLPLMRNYYNTTYYDATTKQYVLNQASDFYLFTEYQNEFMASSALNQRLSYTRYIYSQMYKVYLKGGSFVYPLFFDYPEDDMCFNDIEHTYMLGDSIKVSPVLEKGVTGTFKSYFPAGKWADLNQLNVTFTSNGQMIDLNSSFAYTNIHLKAGRIIPFQPNPNHYKQTKNFLNDVTMQFMIHRDDSLYAEGYILADDGISAGTWDTVDFAFWKLRYAQKSINFWIDWGNFKYDSKDLSIDTLSSIHILDAEDLAGTNFACYLGQNLNPMGLDYSYNPYNKVLTISAKAGEKVKFMDIGFIKFGNSFQEPNLCDPNSAFTYKLDDIDYAQSTDQYIVMTASSLQGNRLLPQLAITARLMDNAGTISLNITTLEDFQSGGTIKFKPPYVTDFTNFNESKVVKRLDSFFTFTANPFSYQIFAEDDPSTVLYQSDPHKLFFDNYMLFDSGIFSLYDKTGYPLLGMGERAGSLFYTEDGIFSRYTFDQANPIDDGLPPGRNMYGFQPMYVYQHLSTNWVGVFDLNSYATDYLLQFNGGVKTQITKVSIGGMIQKYFFVGAKPDDVITRYEMLTGMPLVPPIWTFGWQCNNPPPNNSLECRFGWTTDQKWIDVVNSYEENNLPLDTMWADIDYMDDYKIFTVSQTRYSNLHTYVDQIHKKGMTFVPIMDVGVAVRPNDGYVTYDEAINQNVFIKQANGVDPLTAGVWPGHAYFPSFFHENITNYWHSQFDYLTSFYQLEFDGIWIDMNEATNFCNGYCIPSERPVDSLRNKAYYVPGWRDLEDKALGVDGVHSKAWNGQDLHEYDVHSMYSLVQIKSTSEYLSKVKGLRPYVLSRSNFPGLAKYGHHWMGDNWSLTEYMKYSVDGIYSYNLFGLPFMGSDICGFDGDADPYLCARWHQLGSLYPFARNHNQNASISQEPYVWNTTMYDAQNSYTDIIRETLRNRYSLIQYYYSRFQDMHYYGGSFFKPLFFEYPLDPLAYKNVEINIMLGDSLKVSMQTTIGEKKLEQATTDYYFPEGSWCQIMPTLDDKSKCFTVAAGGLTKTLPSTLLDYQIHLRVLGGYIVPTQDVFSTKVNTTKDLAKVYTDLQILPNIANSQLATHASTKNAAAVGFIYFDDGVTLVQMPTRFDLYLVLGAAANQGQLIVQQVENAFPRENKEHEQLGTISIMTASQCKLDGVKSVIVTLTDSQVTLSSFSYSATTDIFTVNVVDAVGQHISLYDLKSIDFA